MSQELQEEIDAIEAIYPESVQSLASEIFNFTIPNHEEVSIQVSFPAKYPEEKPNLIQVFTRNTILYPDNKYIEEHVLQIMDQIYNEGEVLVFELLGEVDQFLEQYEQEHAEEIQKLNEKIEQLHVQEAQMREKQKREAKKSPTPVSEAREIDYTKGWIQSDPIVDRGSTFIAYAREVESVEEARHYFDLLTLDRKISRSAHNMNTWRIKGAKGVSYQDCDDDGETAAGLRMLHLLTIMDVWNVMVVVSRWFGGTHLGPDRFKHINAATRDVLIKGGFYDDSSKKKK
ncbi:CIC11C00000005559 [Sungouiella intermedia]|uniref:CIC11C00000005559 n=1 Tax=Sungouiella intermedia TaxID=45354 RepID=A0A1L0D467_9ASCO|nr:CIC11C00000005559 [[Candida] intermedia]